MPIILTDLKALAETVKLNEEFEIEISAKRLDESDQGDVAMSCSDGRFSILPSVVTIRIPKGKTSVKERDKFEIASAKPSEPVKVGIAGEEVGIDGQAEERHSTSVKVTA
ncbi:MAG TPA: hypothetical protein VJ860_12200 [Polyangia bacterium]|jgi:hypothetical protein|nr:hypothetical protein [Polyangia bacterium]